jgi:Na+/proline symporter
MEKLSKRKLWQAAACLACVGVLWIRLDDFGASEFSGGQITAKLFTMADFGSLLFLVALLLTIFFPRVAAAIALAGALLCLPFYLYILMPGPYRQIFKGEYSVPLQRPFVWNSWAVVGVLSLVIVAFLSLHSLSKGRARLVRQRR